jgi:2-oxoglutarate/2-oxoacid ferredoxin oxidoreductase subunit beta
MTSTIQEPFTSKELITDQEVRWCPGCGDYSILKQVQSVIPEIGVNKQDIVFISGIGCSSRFPYYMETYGMHSIHGRAAAIATGLKATRPELSVWMITGDGDSLSIGGNHLIHLLRRNLDINVLLFNNEIYGLTKGQNSPTSQLGQVTKSSPLGTVDHPFNPIALCLGANATFVARSLDRDPLHLRAVLKEANLHKGTSLVEIYQNCNVFNDGAFEIFTEKDSKKDSTIMVEHGKPFVFGQNLDKGIMLDGTTPKVVSLDTVSVNDLWIHDKTDAHKAYILSRFFGDIHQNNPFPRPFGVFYAENRSTLENDLNNQILESKKIKGNADINALLRGNNTWTID